MRRLIFIESIIFVIGLLLMPAMIRAQSAQPTTNPPIAQPLVREGDFAIRLVEALNLGTAASETEAESMLGSVGIAPRNGWIADYPVTPDIIGELRNSVSDAANSGRLTLSRDSALEAFQNVTTEFSIGIRPYAPGRTAEQPETYEQYPNPTVINNYYYNEGPPIVTYYPPPPDYFYLYSWVPYPFWWGGFWFPGYYCLGDFHRVVHVHNRVEVISNHFVDHRDNKVFRIDPVRRFNGKTFRGIGLPSKVRGLINPNVQGGSPRVFSGSRERSFSGSGANSEKTFIPPSGRTRAFSPPSNTNRTSAPVSGLKGFRPPSGSSGAEAPFGGSSPNVSPSGGSRPTGPLPGTGVFPLERGQRGK